MAGYLLTPNLNSLSLSILNRGSGMGQTETNTISLIGQCILTKYIVNLYDFIIDK